MADPERIDADPDPTFLNKNAGGGVRDEGRGMREER